jgi:hypothetical protein
MAFQPPEPTPAEQEEALRRRSLESKAAWHRDQASMPLTRKVAILLALQRQDLPLVAKRRPLRPWERPWEIEP